MKNKFFFNLLTIIFLTIGILLLFFLLVYTFAIKEANKKANEEFKKYVNEYCYKNIGGFDNDFYFNISERTLS